jgi:2-C-methyl-D-erythritol 4-phosphate cytidylyltransferase/2-C-methyl-D-erythritol 2,4-cyclodiphosphate synthase
MTRTFALIVGAGSGTRAHAGAGRPPKQYAPLAGKPALRWSVETFARHPAIDAVRVVIREPDRGLCLAALDGLPVGVPIFGGDTRQESVRNGLEAIAGEAPDRVLIHDSARPFTSAAVISRVVSALDQSDAAAPFLPVTDTLRRRSGDSYEPVARDGLFRAQTPQGFRFGGILEAHRRFATTEVTDDVALAERAGLSFTAVPGDERNIKLTTADDIDFAGRIAAAASEMRTGTGFDVHRFVAGDHVWLCGVKIPHVAGLEGHSDADAGLHALTDAILGAICEGDIGVHFPPSDARWKGAPSHLFLAHALSHVRKKGGSVSHVDVTIICERPKLASHREAMRARIAEILDIELGRVSVKATTTEGLGFTGRGEGIAAQAIATVRLPA